MTANFTPPTTRPWIDDETRAALALQLDCDVSEVDARLDAREAAHAYMAERAEREFPFSHARPGARALTYAERVF